MTLVQPPTNLLLFNNLFILCIFRTNSLELLLHQSLTALRQSSNIVHPHSATFDLRKYRNNNMTCNNMNRFINESLYSNLNLSIYNSPLLKNVRFESRKSYRDTTTGWTELWLWTAVWNGPFLNGNNRSPWLRLPSGNSISLAESFWIAALCLLSFSTASLLLLLSMNNVP